MQETMPVREEASPFGGLESITEEEIRESIRDYPYVMGMLKSCRRVSSILANLLSHRRSSSPRLRPS